ncbi:MAG: PPOX class probable FMN-dependent enzyme [Acidimicrobiales bacterium]|jgi:PPOX class probable FMN-dependent enzyme
MFDPKYVITTGEELRSLVPTPRLAQQTKVRASLDTHARRWIGRSPFVVISSVDADGRMDLSPKGDAPGFVRVLDDRTLAVPDRPGNHRMDTFANVLQRANVGLLFVVPGRGEVVRVAGTAQIVRDPKLLDSMAVDGRSPALCLVITVSEVMFHCGKSVIRSRLWSPEDWPPIDDLASYAQCLADQASTDETAAQMEVRFARWHQGDELY